MELLDLFPRTIAVAEVHSLTDIIGPAIELIDRDCGSNRVVGDGDYTSEQQLLNKPLFREVRQEILKLCRDFSAAHSHIIDDITICNSWGNIVSKGDSIRYHRHSNAYISGTLYLSEGSPLNLIDRDREHLFGLTPALRQDNNPRALESFSIPPKPGRIVIFPSGLMHAVLTSHVDHNRYSISFNAVPVWQIGFETSFLVLGLVLLLY